MYRYLLLVLLVSGCASKAELEVLSEASSRVAQMQMQAAITQRPTIELKCGNGTEACKGLQFSYTDPRDVQKVTGTKVTGTNDVIIGVTPNIVKGVGYVAGAVAATKVVSDLADSMGGGNTITHNNVSIVGDNNTPDTKTTLDYSKTSTTTSSSYSTTNTDSYNTTDSNDKVADPLVVKQEPVVVKPEVVKPDVVNPVVTDTSPVIVTDPDLQVVR